MTGGTDLGTPMLGNRNKLYLATSFSWSSPTWNEAETVKEIDYGEEADGKEISSWGSSFIGEELGYEKKTLTLKFARYSADPDIERLLAARRNRTPVIACVASGDIEEADITRSIAAWVVKKRSGANTDDNPDEISFELGLYRPLQYPPVYDVTT